MSATTSHHLDRCGACSLAGERAADELFGCTTGDLDPDILGDTIAFEGIARDKERCANCPGRDSIPGH